MVSKLRKSDVVLIFDFCDHLVLRLSCFAKHANYIIFRFVKYEEVVLDDVEKGLR